VLPHRAAKVPWHRGAVEDIFPSPADPVGSRTEIFLGHLDYFRGRIITKTEALGDKERRSRRLPSGWTSREPIKHLSFVELRWLEWGFEGRQVDDPWRRSSTPRAAHASGGNSCRLRASDDLPELDPPFKTITSVTAGTVARLMTWRAVATTDRQPEQRPRRATEPRWPHPRSSALPVRLTYGQLLPSSGLERETGGEPGGSAGQAPLAPVVSGMCRYTGRTLGGPVKETGPDAWPLPLGGRHL
jgi:hypothetical protein